MSIRPMLVVPAIRVSQNGRDVFAFVADGRDLARVTTVSRVRRVDGSIAGYQRPEILRHVDRIRAFLEAPGSILPNAIVVAFGSSTRFREARGARPNGWSCFGELHIPDDPDAPDEAKAGFVVDGQQRLAAIRESALGPFPVLCGAFVSDDPKDHAGQFVAVNSAQPLSKSLVYELLPDAAIALPDALERRRVSAALMVRLNTEPDSPLFRMIKTATQPSQLKKKEPYEGLIKDASMLKAIENSLADGLLSGVRDDREACCRALFDFWSAVSTVFAGRGWKLPAKESRLMHGSGIVALGLLMDTIGDSLRRRGRKIDRAAFEAELRLVADACAWTKGEWNFGPGQRRAWNAVQNTAQDLTWLSTNLFHLYRSKVAPGAAGG